MARLASNFAGVATADDSRNDIVIRGNSPTGLLRFSEQVSLLLTGYFQTGWDKSIEALRNRVSGDLALNVRMGKRLELSVKSTFSYEDRPIIPISRSVYALSNGLNYRF